MKKIVFSVMVIMVLSISIWCQEDTTEMLIQIERQDNPSNPLEITITAVTTNTTDKVISLQVYGKPGTKRKRIVVTPTTENNKYTFKIVYKDDEQKKSHIFFNFKVVQNGGEEKWLAISEELAEDGTIKYSKGIKGTSFTKGDIIKYCFKLLTKEEMEKLK